jgi:predicted membrane-bound spermidine synthase
MNRGERLWSCVGVFLISVAALSFELALSRLFSVALWYHYAFMVVSLALLGYGASGSFLTVFPAFLSQSPERFFPFSAMLFSATSVVAYVGVNHIPFDPFRISWDRLQFVYLLTDYLLLSIPFFFAGLCVGGALTQWAENVGRIYAADLAGAGVGSLVVLFMFTPLGGTGIVALPAALAASGAVIFSLKRPVHGWSLFLSILLLVVSLVLMVTRPFFLEVRMSPYKSLKRALSYPESRVLDTRWNAFSRVDVIESPLVRFAPGLSLTFRDRIPPQLGITVDGDSMTAITRYEGQETPLAFVSHLPEAVVYAIKKVDRTLVIEPGGGLGVLTALVLGSQKVDAVFENPLVLEAVSEKHGVFAGHILTDPRVRCVVKSGRSYLRGTEVSYDVIQYAPLSSLGASSSGIRGMHEAYMFTVEAVQDVINHLAPEGFFSITQYLLPPPRQEIRLVHLVLESLKKMGVVAPERHLAAIRSWGTFTVLVKRRPLSKKDIQSILSFCERERFDTVYFPGITEDHVNRYNRFSRPIYFEMFRELLRESGRKRLVTEYVFDVTPVTDDNPFFFNFFKLSKVVPLYKAIHKKWQPFVEGGYLVPVVLVESVLASVFLIVVPLLFRRQDQPWRRNRSRFWILVYFALLGWGYMFVEIVLIQKFILFLDQPIYAMTTVIAALLVSSGLGSLASHKVTDRGLHRGLVLVLGIVSVIVLAFLGIVPLVTQRFLGLAWVVRELVTVVLLFPLGFLMGMPFPLGLRYVRREDRGVIPWAWCANGCFSVMGAVLAVVMALKVGFSGVLVLAVMVYAGGGIVLVAFLNFSNHRNKQDTA